MKEKEKRLKQLVEEINKHNYNYYTLDNPTISDKEWDVLYDELVALEKELGIVLPHSPTVKISDTVLKGFKKIKHNQKIYSLDKCNCFDELKNWVDGIEKELANQTYSLEHKLDGISIIVKYKDGKIDYAATRGDGYTGEDVTKQILTIKTLPLTIPFKETLIIRGEALMTKSSFEEYNRTALEPLKNTRNGAAGAIRTLDLKITASRKVDLFFYDVLYSEGIHFKTQAEVHQFFVANHIPVSNYFKVFDSFEKMKNEIKKIDEIKNKLDFDIDGAVIKLNSLPLREEIGETIKFPKWAIAFKFAAVEVTTKLNEIIWQVGRTGKLTPIALVEPVELAGAIVKRATLNNYGDIQRKNVELNSRVFIRRSNEVIPEILGVAQKDANSSPIKKPLVCPSCGSYLKEDGANLFCENSENCESQIIDNFVHFASRKAMNIVGLNVQTIKQLIKNYNIKTVNEIYEINVTQLLTLDKMKDKKANNLINALINSKNVNLSNFIYALGINGVGEKTARDIAKNFKNFENFRKATKEDLLSIREIGEVICDNILEYFAKPQNNEIINKLFASGIKLNEFQINENKNLNINGKTFVVTGTLVGFKRNEIKELIEHNGGKTTETVTKSTDYVVAGDKAGSKLEKAILLKIKILTEQEFKALLNKKASK